MVILRMSSKKYGVEDFKYGTKEEAKKGRKRIMKRISHLKDGVKRHFKIIKEKKEEKYD